MELKQEQALIESCKSDLSGFTAIYDAYVTDVYRYCFSITQNKEAAEDAVSFAFLQAIEKINEYEFRGKSIKNWIFIIARNYIYKSNTKEVSSEIVEDVADEDESVLELMITEENIVAVKSVLSNLNSEEQEIVKLKIWEEMKFEEISEITGLGLSGVKMKYYRSLEKIKVYFAT